MKVQENPPPRGDKNDMQISWKRTLDNNGNAKKTQKKKSYTQNTIKSSFGRNSATQISPRRWYYGREDLYRIFDCLDIVS